MSRDAGKGDERRRSICSELRALAKNEYTASKMVKKAWSWSTSELSPAGMPNLMAMNKQPELTRPRRQRP